MTSTNVWQQLQPVLAGKEGIGKTFPASVSVFDITLYPLSLTSYASIIGTSVYIQV